MEKTPQRKRGPCRQYLFNRFSPVPKTTKWRAKKRYDSLICYISKLKYHLNFRLATTGVSQPIPRMNSPLFNSPLTNRTMNSPLSPDFALRAPDIDVDVDNHVNAGLVHEATSSNGEPDANTSTSSEISLESDSLFDLDGTSPDLFPETDGELVSEGLDSTTEPQSRFQL